MTRRKKQLVVKKAGRRIVIYCRVSTEDQAENGISLEAQEAKGRAYLQIHDLELVKVIMDSASGKTLDRPGLGEALALLRDGKADGILITKLDRLARKVSIWGELVEAYFDEDSPWSILSVMDHVDTSTASGRLGLNVLMSVYQWERESIAERTRDALAHLAAQGIILGAAPLGARRELPRAPDGPPAKWVEVPHELDIVKRIRTLKAMGHSVRDIAELLNEEDVPTKHRKTKRGKSQWWPTTVQRVLDRDAA